MAKRVLHVLSQRPGRTGSGITLHAIVNQAAKAGWEQQVVVGVPAEDPRPAVGILPPTHVHPVVFSSPDLPAAATDEPPDIPFALPGMSDVMPYPTRTFSSLDENEIRLYREIWRQRLCEIVGRFQPDVIHSNHIWIVSSLLKDVAPDVPLLIHCHATGIRQMELCPHLAESVRAGCRRADQFIVLHRGHAELLEQKLGVGSERIAIVGSGFRPDCFHAAGRNAETGNTVLYAGKLSPAKGLVPLLAAFERLRQRFPDAVLHVAGSGSGPEAEAIEQHMAALSPAVVMHGPLSQDELGVLMRRCSVFVLPSYYEGLPLVLVEAAACGCRLIATALPGVVEQLAPHVGPILETVALPPMATIDTPVETACEDFVDRLVSAMNSALTRRPVEAPEQLVAPFRWDSIFTQIEKLWLNLTKS